MLRVTEEEREEGRVRLRLEGEVRGQGVMEVGKVCEQSLASHGNLELDLAEVVFIDRMGIALFQDLMRRKVELINCSPFLIEQLKQTDPAA